MIAQQGVLGLDIGGANLKAARTDGTCLSRPFPVWKDPEGLAAQIRELIESLAPSASVLAVTMTAELADCYATKAEGVTRITASVLEAAAGRPVLIWLTSGRFATAPLLHTDVPLAAASNWQAQATWLGQTTAAPAVLIDIGTTTTDIIPIDDRRPTTVGLTDPTRLMAGELVYTGVRRTPLCAVAGAVPWQHRMCPLAAELFATTLDVYLWLGDIPEDESDCETANGRPATRAAAGDRLARQICGDRDEVTADEITSMARYLAECQQRQIARALEQALAGRSRRESVLLSGSGSFLARRVIDCHPELKHVPRRELGQELSAAVAEAACAHAVAVLAEAQCKSH